jgi:O-antigen ligase
MVLVVLSDRDPLMTTKAVLMRCSYVLIPMSVVLVKYFPDRARTYDQWTGMAYYTGVSGDKNLLGMTLTALGLSLIWVAASLTTGVPRRRTQFAVCVVLLSATWWLLLRANSATALLCSFTGAALLLLLRTRMIGRRVRMCIGLIVLAGAVAAATGVWSGIEGLLLDVVDRDPSLTGRQEIWDSVLRETVNPLIGAGFYSFWLGDRVQRLSAGYHYLLNEAHNGFLEVYLNGGLIAVTLLAAILLSTIRKGIAATISERDREFGSFRLAVVAVTIIYGLTEAIFSRLDILWFALLLVAAVYRASPVRSPSRREYEEPSGRRSHHVDFARPL